MTDPRPNPKAGVTPACGVCGGPFPCRRPDCPGASRLSVARAPACRDCRHYSAARSECRVNPPTNRAPEPWPVVEPTDFCGRFDPAPAAGGTHRITEG